MILYLNLDVKCYIIIPISNYYVHYLAPSSFCQNDGHSKCTGRLANDLIQLLPVVEAVLLGQETWHNYSCQGIHRTARSQRSVLSFLLKSVLISAPCSLLIDGPLSRSSRQRAAPWPSYPTLSSGRTGRLPDPRRSLRLKGTPSSRADLDIEPHTQGSISSRPALWDSRYDGRGGEVGPL